MECKKQNWKIFINQWDSFRIQSDKTPIGFHGEGGTSNLSDRESIPYSGYLILLWGEKERTQGDTLSRWTEFLVYRFCQLCSIIKTFLITFWKLYFLFLQRICKNCNLTGQGSEKTMNLGRQTNTKPRNLTPSHHGD